MATAPLKRILMIEDDLDIQAVARLALEVLGGFTVAMCSRGREALEAAPAFGPDLVLLDVMMPGMDGPATLEALRKLPALADVPVIFMTARVQQHEIDAYKALGALEVVGKPFDPMALSTTLNAIWEKHCGEVGSLSRTDGSPASGLRPTVARQGAADRATLARGVRRAGG